MLVFYPDDYQKSLSDHHELSSSLADGLGLVVLCHWGNRVFPVGNEVRSLPARADNDAMNDFVISSVLVSTNRMKEHRD